MKRTPSPFPRRRAPRLFGLALLRQSVNLSLTSPPPRTAAAARAAEFVPVAGGLPVLSPCGRRGRRAPCFVVFFKIAFVPRGKEFQAHERGSGAINPLPISFAPLTSAGGGAAWLGAPLRWSRLVRPRPASSRLS